MGRVYMRSTGITPLTERLGVSDSSQLHGANPRRLGCPTGALRVNGTNRREVLAKDPARRSSREILSMPRPERAGL
jgi:hypothetical protein